MNKRMIQFVRDTAELRRELVEEPTNMKAITYSLAATYIAEWCAREPGGVEVCKAISAASQNIVSAALRPEVDKFIEDALGGPDEGSAGSNGTEK